MDTQARHDLNLTGDTPMVYTGVMDAAKPTIPTPAKGTCGCGCGEAVARRFRPGHDARLKSILLDVARRGARHQAERAAWSMIEGGWSRFLDEEILHTLPQRNSRGGKLIPIEQVEVWIMEPTANQGSCHGVCHTNAACPALTRAAKVAGQIHPITKLARPGWLVRSDANEANRAHVLGSWDLCTECTSTSTVLEDCERLWMRIGVGIAALDQEAGNAPKIASGAQRALANKTWTVEPDLDDQGNQYPERVA